jgi:UDP-N-acetylglucosamine:LPS N-acetylglucosamine transferase
LSGHDPSPAPTVAISWHWDYNTGPPEGRWAFPHYAEALAYLRDGPWKLIGHGHPRAWRTLSRYYASLGIEAVRDFDEVMERADLYACDNSSTIFEMAATGRPVVLLNSPDYRRDVEHGLRFWKMADVGLQVDEPGELVPTIARALEDPPEVAKRRAEVVAAVYDGLDGRAAARAARAIEEVAWATRRAHA